MKDVGALLPLVAALLGILGYAVWVLRRLARALEWISRLPREHEFLMETTAKHTDQIGEILNLLTEGKFPGQKVKPPKPPSGPTRASSARRSSPGGSRGRTI